MGYKLKSEYEKLLEVYPNVNRHIKDVSGEFEEKNYYMYNSVTGFCDTVYISKDLVEEVKPKYTYTTTDKLVKLLCMDEDFNRHFQDSCNDQWDDGGDTICICHPIGRSNEEEELDSDIYVFKSDITRTEVA